MCVLEVVPDVWVFLKEKQKENSPFGLPFGKCPFGCLFYGFPLAGVKGFVGPILAHTQIQSVIFFKLPQDPL